MTDHRKNNAAIRSALVVGAHLLVGVLVVGSQALIPTGLIPPALEVWLRGFVAVLMAAGASFLTTITSNGWPAFQVANDEQDFKSSSQTFWRHLKFWRFLLSFTIIAIASWYLYKPSLPAYLAEPEKVGTGLDMVKFCKSLGFDGRADNNCYYKVRTGEVCNEEHGREDLTLIYRDKDTGNGECVNKKGKPIGKNIQNMPGYCQRKFPAIFNVEPKERPELIQWRCEMPINKNVVCISQHAEEGLIARTEKGGTTWRCYRPRKQ